MAEVKKMKDIKTTPEETVQPVGNDTEYLEKYVIPTALHSRKRVVDRGFVVEPSSFNDNKLFLEISAPDGKRYVYDEHVGKLEAL